MKKELIEQRNRILEISNSIEGRVPLNEGGHRYPETDDINELDIDSYPERGGMVRNDERTATWPNAETEVVHQTIVKWLKYIVEKTQKDFPHINISPDPDDLSKIASIILGNSNENPEGNPTNGELNAGDEVTPKDHPELKSTIKKVDKFMGDTVYVLDNGTTYTRDELV